MSQQQWTEVDAYFADRLVGADEALEAALRETEAAGMPEISVSATQGKLLRLLARAQGARRILEIGTLGGYSTIQLARALPAGGLLVTLEYSAEHAEVARRNIARAGLAEVVEIRVGAALDTLPGLASEEPFDFFFIDADKVNNRAYVDWAVKLSRPGSLIVVDNVVRGGAVADAGSTDPSVTGTRELFEHLAGHPGLDATAVQTVGDKGWDGFALVRVAD
ncbi:O-methyltransferase [Streptomyces sp. NPDC060194]|uniref:O-methyltransferase n=1 Tax=Streptomyces sp. NPDC060194 TaxID=3347069 RepID=UPI0036485280